MADKTRNPVGWGYREDALSERHRQGLIQSMQSFLGAPPPRPVPQTIPLTPSRLKVPDAVAEPAHPEELAAVLAWCSDAGHAVIADTFETAVPWSRVPDFYHAVREVTQAALTQTCGKGGVTCRVTHAYPDGVALYFSFYGSGEHAALVEQWRTIKAAASEAVMDGGGTISHHHAMGRDHREWAAREIPEAFQAAFRAARRELDPAGLMNPGLWIDAPRPGA